jgi:hypothetical protein
MKKAQPRQLFVLRDPEVRQAAWVRTDSIEEAALNLYRETSTPVVVEQHRYGWVEFTSDVTRHKKSEDRPLRHWEFLDTVGGPADLIGMPDYIEDLRERVPRKPGQVQIADERPRLPRDRSSIPMGSVILCKDYSNGTYYAEMKCLTVVGVDEIDDRPIKVGELARVDLVEVSKPPKVDDRLRMVVKGEDCDHVVFAKVLDLAVIVAVLEIQEGVRWLR